MSYDIIPWQHKLVRANNSSLRMLARLARLVSQHTLLQILGRIPNNCELRSPTTPVCPARQRPGANNSSLSHPAASSTEQKKKKEQRHGSLGNSDTEQVRGRSPNPSPTHRLVKPDPHRLTEHTK